MNFQILEKAEEPEVKLPTSAGSLKKTTFEVKNMTLFRKLTDQRKLL